MKLAFCPSAPSLFCVPLYPYRPRQRSDCKAHNLRCHDSNSLANITCFVQGITPIKPALEISKVRSQSSFIQRAGEKQGFSRKPSASMQYFPACVLWDFTKHKSLLLNGLGNLEYVFRIESQRFNNAMWHFGTGQCKAQPRYKKKCYLSSPYSIRRLYNFYVRFIRVPIASHYFAQKAASYSSIQFTNSLPAVAHPLIPSNRTKLSISLSPRSSI